MERNTKYRDIQIYHPYYKWECFKSGMWGNSKNENIDLEKAILFTSNHILYGQAMQKVSKSWVYSMENFLTNKNINRKAYLGHCAVMYEKLIPEYITRMAWKYLTDKQRELANNEAQKTIEAWELNRKLKNTSNNGSQDVIQMEYQMKLHLN